MPKSKPRRKGQNTNYKGKPSAAPRPSPTVVDEDWLTFHFKAVSQRNPRHDKHGKTIDGASVRRVAKTTVGRVQRLYAHERYAKRLGSGPFVPRATGTSVDAALLIGTHAHSLLIIAAVRWGELRLISGLELDDLFAPLMSRAELTDRLEEVRENRGPRPGRYTLEFQQEAAFLIDQTWESITRAFQLLDAPSYYLESDIAYEMMLRDIDQEIPLQEISLPRAENTVWFSEAFHVPAAAAGMEDDFDRALERLYDLVARRGAPTARADIAHIDEPVIDGIRLSRTDGGGLNPEIGLMIRPGNAGKDDGSKPWPPDSTVVVLDLNKPSRLAPVFRHIAQALTTEPWRSGPEKAPQNRQSSSDSNKARATASDHHRTSIPSIMRTQSLRLDPPKSNSVADRSNVARWRHTRHQHKRITAIGPRGGGLFRVDLEPERVVNKTMNPRPEGDAVHVYTVPPAAARKGYARFPAGSWIRRSAPDSTEWILVKAAEPTVNRAAEPTVDPAAEPTVDPAAEPTPNKGEASDPGLGRSLGTPGLPG